jgi:tRNA (guanine-N7-)-methyltransferase
MSGAPLIESAADGDEGVYTEGREGHGHIKSFVRRAGRMSEAQQRYFAR